MLHMLQMLERRETTTIHLSAELLLPNGG